MRPIALVLLCFGCTTQQNALVLPGDPTATSGTGTVSKSGLPCDVDALLATYCRACHGARPAVGVPMSLMTFADLMAPAKTSPSTRVVDLCLTRIQDSASPMPPSPPAPTASEVKALADWIAAGTPMGTCGSAADPVAAAPVCTSGTQWTGGNEGSSRMNPGQACISCHAGGEGPRFAIAGTVYPTGHEPDLCNGTGAAQVVITDANGSVVTLTPNSAGNFSSRASIALPYHAEVVANGKTRAMSAAQSSGDCNGCHTQNGANGAPGRITLP